METIKNLVDMLIVLVRCGTALRVVFCCIKMGMNEEESGMYKKRLRNVIVFYILAELSWQLKDTISNYYS